MTTIIHIDPEAPLAVLDERGWNQGSYDDGTVCLHGAIRLCQPVPGDAYLIEQVAERQGWGTSWNDDDGTTEAMVRDRLALGIDVTDTDLADTFGPQWRAVVSLVRKAATLTADEAARLVAAEDAARGAAWNGAWAAARNAAGAAAWNAAWTAAGTAARAAAGTAARAVAWTAARAVAWAVATWDLATEDGPYTFAHRDLLIGPWREVCGLPEGLLADPEVARYLPKDAETP